MSVIYRGIPDGCGCNVQVVRDGKASRLKHYVGHSPSGFASGYNGSGPADLARCILVDFLALKPKWDNYLHRSYKDGSSFPVIDAGVYQAFKRDVIANLPQLKPWELADITIIAWLTDHAPALLQKVSNV